MRASDLSAAYALQLEIEKLRQAQQGVRYIASHGSLNFNSPESDRELGAIPINKQELIELIDRLIVVRVERLGRLGVVEQ